MKSPKGYTIEICDLTCTLTYEARLYDNQIQQQIEIHYSHFAGTSNYHQTINHFPGDGRATPGYEVFNQNDEKRASCCLPKFLLDLESAPLLRLEEQYCSASKYQLYSKRWLQNGVELIFVASYQRNEAKFQSLADMIGRCSLTLSFCLLASVAVLF